MIIITGYGRSGTRVIVDAYKKSNYRLGNINKISLDNINVGKIDTKILSQFKPKRPQSTFERYYHYPRIVKDMPLSEDLKYYLEIEMAKTWLNTDVLKRPSFNVTLQFWIKLGFIPDLVLIIHRNIDKAIKRQSTHTKDLDFILQKNRMLYNYGNLFTTLLDCNVPFRIIKFPEDINQSTLSSLGLNNIKVEEIYNENRP